MTSNDAPLLAGTGAGGGEGLFSAGGTLPKVAARVVSGFAGLAEGVAGVAAPAAGAMAVASVAV